mmetsp:Transcript_7436/g.15164  ORF Transcript_7436/g.15164 Transcript_7436/m.15164 type:complete len:264 (+) Transcript_7436:199-990(+)|eukprot:CAMPEP_0168731892 /NCGR_PEP_ID=MMETSP0724-20121128/7494_1 /TAXON_ID=265536 /ORGANISM="Amphiprora sp., Strain CCMP467" /LENGTH=263 /DNA_ID=CAMNT_0008778903 /DNA_START=175 /DNA_END=966 /DNA_ORIENTATION=-
MGNTIARDFHNVELANEGSVPILQKELIAPGSTLLKKPISVVLRHDHNRNSTIVFDEESMLPLFVTSNKKKKKTRSSSKSTPVVTSCTKDSQGHMLYLTTAPSKNTRLIFKAPKSSQASSSSSSFRPENHTLDDNSSHSFTSTTADSTSSPHVCASWSDATSARCKNSNLPCAAQIDIDSSGAAVTAFLSVTVWRGTGPDLVQVYKAVKISQVKYGALVVDNQGQVVGKSAMDEDRLEPRIEIARGADIPSVVALVSTLCGEF